MADNCWVKAGGPALLSRVTPLAYWLPSWRGSAPVPTWRWSQHHPQHLWTGLCGLCPPGPSGPASGASVLRRSSSEWPWSEGPGPPSSLGGVVTIRSSPKPEERGQAVMPATGAVTSHGSRVRLEARLRRPAEPHSWGVKAP